MLAYNTTLNCGVTLIPQLRSLPSWHPPGIFAIAKRPAKYIKDHEVGFLLLLEVLCVILTSFTYILLSQIVKVPEGLFPENIVQFGASKSPFPGVEFEGYYNKDVTRYSELYNIPKVHTLIRGTYRYKVRGIVCSIL